MLGVWGAELGGVWGNGEYDAKPLLPPFLGRFCV